IGIIGERRERPTDRARGTGTTRQPRHQAVRRDPALGNVAHDLVDAVIEQVHVLPGAPRGHLQPTAAAPFVQRAARYNTRNTSSSNPASPDARLDNTSSSSPRHRAQEYRPPPPTA